MPDAGHRLPNARFDGTLSPSVVSNAFCIRRIEVARRRLAAIVYTVGHCECSVSRVVASASRQWPGRGHLRPHSPRCRHWCEGFGCRRSPETTRHSRSGSSPGSPRSTGRSTKNGSGHPLARLIGTRAPCILMGTSQVWRSADQIYTTTFAILGRALRRNCRILLPSDTLDIRQPPTSQLGRVCDVLSARHLSGDEPSHC